MSEANEDDISDPSASSEDDQRLVRGVYVYTGPKIIADSKMRLAEWLERRG